MAYRVNNTIYFLPNDAEYYTKWFFGDGSETYYDSYYSDNWASHTYSYPFIYPICWMDVDYWGDYHYASSATLDYLVVGDVGNTVYNFIPTGTNKNEPTITYNSTNHVVNITYYSENINTSISLKLKQKIHYDVQVNATNVSGGIKYSFTYPYGKPIFVYWSFGDGTHSLENSPVHTYPNDGIDYQAHVMIVDENGVVSVGFGPVVENNRIVSPTFTVQPTIVTPNTPVYIYYTNPLSNPRMYLDIYYLNYNKDIIDYDLGIKLYYYIGKKIYYLDNVTITYKFPSEGIYYIEGYDFYNYYDWLDDDYATHFLPRMILVVNNHNPVATLYVYPNPASYKDVVFFNPLNSYDPDANRVLENSGGYVISPDSPMARIYGFNLTVYDSKGNEVWNYTSNELKVKSSLSSI